MLATSCATAVQFSGHRLGQERSASSCSNAAARFQRFHKPDDCKGGGHRQQRQKHLEPRHPGAPVLISEGAF